MPWGGIAQWLPYLLTDPAAPGLNHSSEAFSGKISYVAVFSDCTLLKKRTVKKLNLVNQIHPVLAGGNLVLQKSSHSSDTSSFKNTSNKLTSWMQDSGSGMSCDMILYQINYLCFERGFETFLSPEISWSRLRLSWKKCLPNFLPADLESSVSGTTSHHLCAWWWQIDWLWLFNEAFE